MSFFHVLRCDVVVMQGGKLQIPASAMTILRTYLRESSVNA